MWKKVLFIGFLSIGSFGVIGCHSHHQMANQSAVSTEENEKNETQLTVDQLPPEVVKTVNKHLPDATIVSVESQVWKGKVVYEIDAKSGDTVYELKVQKSGKFISKAIDKD